MAFLRLLLVAQLLAVAVVAELEDRVQLQAVELEVEALERSEQLQLPEPSTPEAAVEPRLLLQLLPEVLADRVVRA
jgi:hypothetical protein